MPATRYRLVVLDLDDTLLVRDEQIGEVHREAVFRARASGLAVTLATARSWRGTVRFATELQIDQPVICMTGAALYSPGGAPLRLHPLDLGEARALVAEADRAEWAVRLYFADGRIVQSRPPQDYQTKTGAHYPAETYAGDLLPCMEPGEAPIQVVAVGHRSVEGSLNALSRLPGIAATPYERGSATSRVHLMRARVTKATALQELCQDLAIAREEVIAMGDGLPDLEMLRWAGLGVAMGWAAEPVRQAADLVMEAGDPHPVATALRQILGI